MFPAWSETSFYRKITYPSRKISGIYFHLNLTMRFSLQINMLSIIESSNLLRFSCSKYYGQISFHLVFSKLTGLHWDMLITNLIFKFSIFFPFNFLLVFKEVQSDWKSVYKYGKTALISIKVWAIWCLWLRNWTLFTSDCCLRNRNNSYSKTHLLIFLSVIEDIYVLLISGFGYFIYFVLF